MSTAATEVGWRAAIAENVIEVRERIAAAARRSGRSSDSVTLVAVSKRHPAAAVATAVAVGVTDIGENYVQEAEIKLAEADAAGGMFRKHLIGHLQRNKAARAAAFFDVVQTVDSVALVAALSKAVPRQSESSGRVLDVLIEVNISGEISKSGVAAGAAPALAEAVAQAPGLRLVGLMGMAPLRSDGDGEAAARRSFRALAALQQELPMASARILSMGMTGDFEWAIEEGSTMVRIGPKAWRDKSVPGV